MVSVSCTAAFPCVSAGPRSNNAVSYTHLSVFARSLILAAISTVVCLVMAFPVGYFLSRLRANKQHIMLMLLMLPMCCLLYTSQTTP